MGNNPRGILREYVCKLQSFHIVVLIFVQLECVCQADAVEGRIGFCILAHSIVVGVFNINGRNIISQQNDFVCMQFFFILALQIFMLDQSALDHTGNKRTGPGKGVDNMYVLVANFTPEFFFQYVGHALVNKVNDLHRGIDNTQFFYGLG